METRKRRTTATATTRIEDLSDDLTVDILRFLPSTSIIRCLNVCKRWRSLLTSNSFFFLTDTINVMETYNRHEKYMFLERGLGGGMRRISELDFSFHFPNKKRYKRRILTCCNGLLFSSYFNRRRKSLTHSFISNPWTKECVRLPNTTFELGEYIHYGLAFEKNSSVDNNNNVASYKVVIADSNFPCSYQFNVYSSDKKEWQQIQKSSDTLLHCRCTLESIAVYCNRVLYWLCSRKCRGKQQHALMLNVETETPGYLYLPGDNKDDENIPVGREVSYLYGFKLIEHDGQLRYIRIVSAESRLRIWKRLTSDEWSELHNVDLKGAVESNLDLFPLHDQGRCFENIEPVGMSLQGDDKVLLKYANRRIVSYDLKKNKIELVLEKDAQGILMGTFFRYTPTSMFIIERKYIWQQTKKKYTRKEVSMSTPNYANQRPNAYWSPQQHRTFLELCVEQVHKGNRSTRSFNRIGWNAIIKGFTQRTGLHYDKKQMRNHYNSTKYLWKAWKALVGKSDMRFDPILHTITAPDEAWAAYIKANPRAASLRNRPLEFEDKLDIIFRGTTTTEDNS